MDNFIKNIKPELYLQLLDEVESAKVENKKIVIEMFLRHRLQIFSTLAKHTSGYWSCRGWSDEESYIKAKENKQKNIKSCYSQNTWLEKINPLTEKFYTIEEADFERNSRRPIRKEYWIKKGYSESESLCLANDTKHKNNKNGAEGSKKTNIHRFTSKRCIEYYTSRGHTKQEAIDMVSSAQKHFSKSICIEKYGETKGLTIWQRRQDNWQKTLNAKSESEKSRINRLKVGKGCVVSKAERILLEHFQNTIPQIIHQYTLFVDTKKQYIYDFMFDRKIIEYNGDFWHCNPTIYSADFVNPRTKMLAKDKWATDTVKLQHARDSGYEVLVIWESDFIKNKEDIIKKCIQFLTQ